MTEDCGYQIMRGANTITSSKLNKLFIPDKLKSPTFLKKENALFLKCKNQSK